MAITHSIVAVLLLAVCAATNPIEGTRAINSTHPLRIYESGFSVPIGSVAVASVAFDVSHNAEIFINSVGSLMVGNITVYQVSGAKIFNII